MPSSQPLLIRTRWNFGFYVPTVLLESPMTPLQAQSPVSRYMALVLRSVFKPAPDTRNQLQFCIWNESHAPFSVPQQSQATIQLPGNPKFKPEMKFGIRKEFLIWGTPKPNQFKLCYQNERKKINNQIKILMELWIKISKIPKFKPSKFKTQNFKISKFKLSTKPLGLTIKISSSKLFISPTIHI